MSVFLSASILAAGNYWKLGSVILKEGENNMSIEPQGVGKRRRNIEALECALQAQQS